MKEQVCIALLALSYALLVGLHLVLLNSLNVRRIVKVMTVVLMSAFCVSTFFWMQGVLGWSAAVAVPERFKIVATRVIEPDQKRRRVGAIHLWLEELDDRNIPSGVPRAYLLPYSPDLAAKVMTADAEIKKGNPQGGSARSLGARVGVEPDGANVRGIASGLGSGGDPSGGGALAPSSVGGQSSQINLISLPPPLLPRKDDP